MPKSIQVSSTISGSSPALVRSLYLGDDSKHSVIRWHSFYPAHYPAIEKPEYFPVANPDIVSVVVMFPAIESAMSSSNCST